MIKIFSHDTVIEEYKNKIYKIKQIINWLLKTEIWLFTTKLLRDRIKLLNRL